MRNQLIFVPATGLKQQRAVAIPQRRKEPEVPQAMREIFSGLNFEKSYHNGILIAQFERALFWGYTLEFVGFYSQGMRGPNGFYAERYIWAYRHGEFVEVCQFGVRDVAQRIFVGMR
jgi:hypothetical protein